MPLPVRERMIPKRGGKLRRLGIPTVRDRVVQAALKLVLEPIFEADFQPCSYGFRPGRRAQDAIAEIHYLTSPAHYEWVVGGRHQGVLRRDRPRGPDGPGARRIADKRVLALVKAFLQGRHPRPRTAASRTRSPAPRRAGSSRRCWPTSPCPSWTSTSPRAWAAMGTDWQRRKRARARRGRPIGWSATRTTSWSWSPATRRTPRRCVDEVAAVLAPMGLRLSPEKTRITPHRRGLRLPRLAHPAPPRRGTAGATSTPTRPRRRSRRSRPRSRRSRAPATQPDARPLLRRLNPVLRGWCTYFRHGVSGADLRLPARLHVAAGRRLAAPQAPQRRTGAGCDAATSRGGGRPTARRCSSTPAGADRALPLPGGRIATPWAQGRSQRDPAQILERLQTLIAR